MKKLTARQKKWIERTVANNRGYKSALYNRFFILLLLALAQVSAFALLVYLVNYHSKWGVALQTLSTVSALAFVVYILNTHDKPSMRLGWIIVVLLAPVFGVPTYLLAGRGVFTKKLREAIVRSEEAVREARVRAYGEADGNSHEDKGGVSKLLFRVTGAPAYENGSVIYYDGAEKAYPQMLQAIENAKRFILLEYFIIAHGEMWNGILKRLLEKAEQGVQVRILYDDFGCIMRLPPRYDKYLESLHENIKCTVFNKVVPVFTVRVNHRDHRKMLIVDNVVAFTGGFNLADEYIGKVQKFGLWKDAGVQITGEAVREFTGAFFTLWNACRADKERVEEYFLPTEKQEEIGEMAGACTKIQPYDDSPLDNVSVGEAVYTAMLDGAEAYAYIFTPYLILDDFLRASLCKASLRGVDVRIVTPAIPDKKTVFRLTRANYAPLLRAGVKIYEYTSGFIHSKCMVCDGKHAVVGTVNFDYRSLYHHFENAVYFSDCEAVMEVQRDAERTFAVSTPRTEENCQRGVFGRLFDSLLRVFETLL